ncbi:uncharacterized protein F54H12.2 [Folsomia candida]|uniref:uncharacterized protein F54H12.2 n=1 Tax=Folsomia candida TaxID=158441 RepID=UPI001604EB1B|nr:uncharacterized protein F54H12.2 [Folsomia candida]
MQTQSSSTPRTWIIQCQIQTLHTDFSPIWPQPGYSESEGNPFIFHIPALTNHFTDLASSYLYLRLRIQKENGSDLDTEDDIAPNENFFASYIESVNLELNSTPVSRNQNSLYLWRHFMENYLFESEGVKKSTLSTELFYLDENEKYDTTNANYAVRKAYTNGSKQFEVTGILKHSLQSQSRLIPDGVHMTLAVKRSKNTLALFGNPTGVQTSGETASQKSYKIKVESAIFYCHRVQLTEKVLTHVHAMLSKNRLNFLMKSKEMKSFNIPTGSYTASNVLFSGPTPTFLILGLLTAKQYIGSYGLSPFAFSKHNLDMVTVQVEGESNDFLRTLNFQDGSLLGYKSLNSLCTKQLGNGIGREEYEGRNRFLMAVELLPSAGDQFQTQGHNQTKLLLKFSQPTTEPLVLVCMAEFPSLLQVLIVLNIFLFRDLI